MDGLADGTGSLGANVGSGADGTGGADDDGPVEIAGLLGRRATGGGTATGAVLDAVRGPDVRSG
jgi:hypothetical protein